MNKVATEASIGNVTEEDVEIDGPPSIKVDGAKDKEEAQTAVNAATSFTLRWRAWPTAVTFSGSKVEVYGNEDRLAHLGTMTFERDAGGKPVVAKFVPDRMALEEGPAALWLDLPERKVTMRRPKRKAP